MVMDVHMRDLVCYGFDHDIYSEEPSETARYAHLRLVNAINTWLAKAMYR